MCFVEELANQGENHNTKQHHHCFKSKAAQQKVTMRERLEGIRYRDSRWLACHKAPCARSWHERQIAARHLMWLHQIVLLLRAPEMVSIDSQDGLQPQPRQQAQQRDQSTQP